MWALDAATGKPAGVWTAPIPSAQWFEAAAALAPSGPCCEFAPTAGVASSDGKSFLVFCSMRGVRDPDHFDATVPYAVRTVLGQDGSWGKVEPMPIAEPSPVPNLFASGALWDVQRGHGSEILFGLSTHDRVGASGSSVYENQVVRLDAKGEVLTVEPLPGRVAGRLIPGMQDGDTPRAGMLCQLESGRWAVVRSREPGDLRQVSRGVPELLLLDRHGNLLVRRTVPLAWTKPHWNRAPRRESPDDVRLDRSMVEPAVAEEPNGRLLVAAEQQLWRTTPWLQFDDNEAGVCADKTLDDCDDGNPCTADLCAPTNGCVHPPHLDGAPCGVGKACSEGSCVAGK